MKATGSNGVSLTILRVSISNPTEHVLKRVSNKSDELPTSIALCLRERYPDSL